MMLSSSQAEALHAVIDGRPSKVADTLVDYSGADLNAFADDLEDLVRIVRDLADNAS